MMLFLSSIVAAFASECSVVDTLPSAVQVAWISSTSDTVRPKQMVEVVHLQALQSWIDTQDADAKAVLHQVGMLPKRSKKTIDPADYKITIFDVESESLCRPIVQEEVVEGESPVFVEGLSVCEGTSRASTWDSRYGFTGCGYTLNTQSQQQGLDVYRVSWAEASTWGFCVLPLSRFLMGAPK
jgi:hypothetical protein